MKKSDIAVKAIIIEACLVATWTDGKMSSEEHRYLSHLIQSLADNDEERRALRNLRFQVRSEEHVHAKISNLLRHEKTFVLDTCLEILASDKFINMHELRFLSRLRKSCEIGWRPYRQKLSSVQKRTGARSAYRTVLLRVSALLMFATAAVLATYDRFSEADIPLTENSTGEEIQVTVLEPDEVDHPEFANAEEVFQHISESIVLVRISIGNDPVVSGSGAVIGSGESGLVYVVTNRHVVRNSFTDRGNPGDVLNIEVEQHSGAKFDAELDFYSRDHDIALLAVKGMQSYARPIELILKENLRVGQPVYAAGTPIGLEHTFTAGVISALRESYLQTDATIHSGSSGGPIVDQHGALSAIATRGHTSKDYAFGIYADALLDVLEERDENRDASSEKGKSE